MKSGWQFRKYKRSDYIIKTEEKKVYYTNEVITEVKCDICGKDLSEVYDSDIIQIDIKGKYLSKDKSFLEHSALNGKRKELCRECLTPILEILKIPKDEIF